MIGILTYYGKFQIVSNGGTYLFDAKALYHAMFMGTAGYYLYVE